LFFNFKEDQRWAKHLALVTQLGLTMAGSILLCFAIGYFLDKWLHTKVLFVIMFVVLGIAGGAVTVYRQIMDTMEQNNKEK
jgi:ATP synthase protein I